MYKNFFKRIIDFTIVFIALSIIWPILLLITIWLHFANKGAGAMGVPSIASNIPGCNEVVIDGKTGILIPSHSSQAIIESIENLYNDKELLNYIKSNCRDSIIERYEQKKLWQCYKEYYLRKKI